MTFFIKIFLEYLKLDISIFIEEYTNEKLDLLSSHESNLSKKGILIRIISYVKKMLLNSSFAIKKNACESNFLLAINSENEFQSSKFLISKENKPFILGDYPKKHGFISYMIGLSLLPLVLFKIITLKDPKFLKSLPYTLDQLMISSGLFFSYSYFFKRNKLKSIILSNHMNPASRVILFLAKKNKIKTVYLEHTIIIEDWPKIECDFFLLSGKNSLNNLKKINNHSEYEYSLVGSPKLDLFPFKKRKINLEQISICLSPGFDFLIINSLINELIEKFKNSKILLRPHQAIRKSYLKPLKKIINKSVEINYPKSESLKSFFNKSDLIISADSGIFFEAAFLGIISLKYKMSNSQRDVYNAKKNGFEIYETPQSLIKAINNNLKNPEKDRTLLSEFYHTLGTEFEGKSGELSINFLKKKDLI